MICNQSGLELMGVSGVADYPGEFIHTFVGSSPLFAVGWFGFKQWGWCHGDRSVDFDVASVDGSVCYRESADSDDEEIGALVV